VSSIFTPSHHKNKIIFVLLFSWTMQQLCQTRRRIITKQRLIRNHGTFTFILNTFQWRKYRLEVKYNWLYFSSHLERSLNPGRKFFHLQTRPDQLWGPPRIYFNVYRCSFPDVKRSECDVDHTPPSKAEVQTECSYTSTPPMYLNDMYETTLPFWCHLPFRFHIFNWIQYGFSMV
jgi:hypothetical protein